MFKKLLKKKKGVAKVKPSTFSKRTKKYNVEYNYIEDVEYPRKCHRFVMIVASPTWYNMILVIIFVETLFCLHIPILGSNRPSATDKIDVYYIFILMELFYVCDILFTIIAHYIVKLEFHNEAARPFYIIIMEVIGCIPLHHMVQKPDLQIKLAAIRCLKCVRLFYHFYKSRTSLNSGIKAFIVKFFCSIIICQSSFAWLYFILTGEKGSYVLYIQLFEIASAQIVGKGAVVSKLHHYSEDILYNEVPLSFASILVMFIIIKPTLCDIISLLTMQYEDKYRYIFKVNFFEKVMVRKYETNPHSTKTLMVYLQNYWEEREGVLYNESMDNSVSIAFPYSLVKEMRIDVTYEVFKHAPVLRDLEIHVMRNLSQNCRNRLYMKGEYVYRKKALVDFMVYIHRGNIDILSKEDGDVAILTFTAGTVIGEIALIFPFKSPVNVRCQTVCELSFIHRADFMQMARFSPESYEQILELLNSRLVYAKLIHKAKLMANQQENMEEQIIWLKSTLHRLMSRDVTIQKYHFMTNIYLAPFLDRLVLKQVDSLHTKRYLGTLSIKRRNDTNYDLVFVRSKCIWILKYNSPVYKVWDFFIATLAFVMALVQPYVHFNEYNPMYSVIIAATYVIFFVDFLLSLITPISIKSTATTLSEIYSERFRTAGFYLDICSMVYFPMFGHVFPFANSDWIFILHAVKLWKVFRMMNKWEKRFKLNLLVQKYCVFVLSFFIYVYTLGYLLKMDGVIDDPFSPVGIQISTGVGFKIVKEPLRATILYSFINTFAVVFESLGVVSVTSANYMKFIRKRRIYQAMERLYKLTKKNPKAQLFKRLGSFLNTQINDNYGLTCRYDIRRFFNLPNYYSEILKSQIYAHALKDLEFFKFVPREIVLRVSATASVHTYHRHGFILSYGAVYDVIYILIKGEARTVYGNKFYKTAQFVPLNLLEVLFGLPCVGNFVALTEVTVVSFHYQTFVTLLKKYQQQEVALNLAIRNNNKEVKKVLMGILNGRQVLIKTIRTETLQSFVHFNTANMVENTFEEYDYYIPFDKIYPFTFIRYLLMKHTILPDGSFLFWWEVVRCILGYTSGIVFFIPPLSLQTFEHTFTYVLIALDLSALIDIYVRLHVCYFDENGVLISHPLKTAKNYFYTSFAMDLMGMIPIYLLVYDSPQYKIIFNVFHLLQLHRLIGFKNHFFYTNYLFDYIFILLTIILPVNLISCIIFMIDCYDWNNDKNVQIKCKTFKKPNPLGNYVTVAYFTMSTITCTGTGSVVDLEEVDGFILNLISTCSFASTFIRIYVTAYLFGSYYKIYDGAYKLRDKIVRLMNFLRKENVRPYLRKQLKIYYELHWRWLYRINPFYLVHNLSPSLRRDVIYCLYGEHIHLHTCLEDISNRLANFFRNVLFHAEPMIIPKNGYVLTVNDIHSDIYFLLSGSIDVVAANGTVIETIHDGSILGNLENSVYYRQKVSYVTNTVAKLLYIKSTRFYDIIVFFPEIQRSFLTIMQKKLYYIPSKYEETEYEQRKWTAHELRRGYKQYQMYHILSWFHFILPCCLGLHMELYQIAVGEVHYPYLALQYTFDVIHLVHQYCKFFVPYMSHEQEFVMHMVRIKAHSMRRKRIMWKLFFTNIPLDVVLLITILSLRKNLEDWSLLFSLLRLNRLFRWFNIISIYKNGTKKVASFSRMFQLIMLFLLLVYSTQVICTIIAVSDYTYTLYMHANQSQIIREMPVETLTNLRHLLWSKKLALYARYWFLSLLLHTFTHDDLYYPIDDLFELLFLVILMYCTVFESFIMVQYYSILMESMSLRKVIHDIRKYIEVYYKISQASNVLQESAEEAINHYYQIKSVCDDYLLFTNSPRYLHEATMMSIYGYLFDVHPYFEHAHPDFLRQISVHMKNVAYPINSTIVNRRDCVNTLYFMHKGEVAAVQYENDCTWNAQLLFCKGDAFGFEQAFKSLPFAYTYRTVTFCEVVELPWENCKYLMEFFPMTKCVITQMLQSGIKHFITPDLHDSRIRRRRL